MIPRFEARLYETNSEAEVCPAVLVVILVVECRTLASALHRAPPLPRAGDFPRGCAVALQSLSENHAETLLEKRALWVLSWRNVPFGWMKNAER